MAEKAYNMLDREALLKYVFSKLAETPKLAQSYTCMDGSPLKYRRVYPRIRRYVDDFLVGEKHEDIGNRFVVMPGLRGVGKTTILFQIYEYLRNSKGIEQDRILYLPADELKVYLGARIIDAIDVFIGEVHQTTPINLDMKLFVLIDEAHYDREWSQTGKIMYDQSKKIFLIFTGSSALSLEMNVDAARRVKKESVFPMDFSEYILLKYNLFPPGGMAETLRELIFKGDDASLHYASRNENEMRKKMLKMTRPIEKEWEDFICCRGFPFGLHASQIEVYERIFSMVDRVIEKDVFSLQSFNTETRNTISRVLTFLALQKPGGTSDAKLAARLKTSPTLIRSVLDVLEKTHLIFSIKPYGGAGKVVRKPWKYYFLSPSISAGIRFKLGTYDMRDRGILGVLAENLVASYFLRMKETVGMPSGIFYDAEKGGVDFLLRGPVEENIIPVEVGVGKKGETQIKNAIVKYGSKYGIVISTATEKIALKGDVIYIPITTFSFV